MRGGVAEMVAAMSIAGTIGWFVVSTGLPALTVVFWRCVFAAGALLIACLVLQVRREHLSRRVVFLSVIGGLAMVLNWVLLFAAFNRTSIGIATAIYNTQPFMLLACGAMFLGEKLTRQKVAWLVAAFCGLLLVVHPAPGGGTAQFASGVLLSLGAALLWAIAALVTKRLAGTPPPLIALIHVCTGALVLWPFALADAMPRGGEAWVGLTVIGIVHTGVVYILMYDAIHKLPTHLQGALSFIYPVVAIAVDAFAFHHRFDGLQLGGVGMILGAVAGMNGYSLRTQRKSTESPLEASS
jgi:drug/metabolite transporter (DMT)-like permease